MIMNVNDYLVWRGDLPFSLFPFNEVDDLILARFSYLPFDKIKFKDNDTIESISDKMKDFSSEFKIDGDKDLIINLGKSVRFKDLKVSDFVFNKSKEAERQFGAITIHLDDFIYVSYIGTDNSIIGWKEDFNMSFMDNIPAQIEGKKYLDSISSKYSGNIRIGGHSKGGNVAVYSSLYCNKDIIDRIISVCNFDGPGFNKNVILNGNDILKKVKSYIPQESVIGRLLEHEEETIVVLSNEKGLYQHDIFSWEIKKDMIVRSSLTDSSEFAHKTIKEWLINTNPQNRKIFVDGIFDLLYSSNSDSFRELSKSWTKDIPNMLNAYSEISKEDKKVIGEMLKEFSKASSNTFKEESKAKFEEWLGNRNGR